MAAATVPANTSAANTKAAGAEGAEGEGVGDFKTDLNHFCQRFCQRPVTKQDIVYTTNKFGHQYQSIVKLNCLQGQEYAGHLCSNQKDAEKSAAQQAVQAYASQMSTLPPPASKDPQKKRRAQPPLSPAELAAKKALKAEEGENPAITPKTKLNSLCMKIAKRYLQKGETIYECKKYASGYQATVKLVCLPGEWGSRVWAGHVCPTKQKAEQSAAEIALKQISEDEELAEEAAKPKGAGKGKGKGKGKGPSGYGWGMWWGGGADLPRERVSEDRIEGEVLEWRNTFGWVKPAVTLDHPAAQLREGKIYVNKVDLKEGLEALEPGATVEFFVYEDPSGLGGEDVQVKA